MYTPLEWAEHHDYQMVILENVVDIQYWRPLPGWLLSWKNLGYDYKFVHFNSMFAWPTPQSRDRVYFVAWKQGNRRPDLRITPQAFCPACAKDVESIQSWKHGRKKWGKYGHAGQYVYRCRDCAGEITPYYFAAATAIDWSRPIQRIGDRKKPLKEKTLNRIASGLEKFAHEPFLIRLNHLHPQAISVEAPWPTQTTYDDTALVAPPPFLLDHVAEYHPRSLNQPMSTIVGGGNHQSLVISPAWLLSYYNHGQLSSIDDVVPTVTTLERQALVTATATETHVEDCGFRTLEPHEIQAAMAFRRTISSLVPAASRSSNWAMRSLRQ
jgi:DNA (cytosine-5)-methyltransferase 1